MEKVHTAQTTLRKRKMLLAMPLLVLPFLTLGFWALGGGSEDSDGQQEGAIGLNPILPTARIKEEKEGGKMSFYDQAARDSLQRSEWMRSDPYYNAGSRKEDAPGPEGLLPQAVPGSAHPFNPAPAGPGSPPAEQKILEKLALLQKGLNDPSSPSGQQAPSPAPARPDGELSREVDRLEDLMGLMKKNTVEDPELGQLEKVMDKILDIQHPDRVRQRRQEGPAKEEDPGDPLSSGSPAATVSLLHRAGREAGRPEEFWSGPDKEEPEGQASALEAVVHGTQTLRDGALVKLRLTRTARVKGVQIPPGTILYGKVSMGKERMVIRIPSLQYQGALFPVRLEVYDLDGLAGVAVPGALARDAVQESADRSLSALERGLLDPSLKTTAAAAGLSTAKNLLSRKVKEVKVTVKAGYRVLLREQNDRS